MQPNCSPCFRKDTEAQINLGKYRMSIVVFEKIAQAILRRF
jgi:hypothetical protein